MSNPEKLPITFYIVQNTVKDRWGRCLWTAYWRDEQASPVCIRAQCFFRTKGEWLAMPWINPVFCSEHNAQFAVGWDGSGNRDRRFKAVPQ